MCERGGTYPDVDLGLRRSLRRGGDVSVMVMGDVSVMVMGDVSVIVMMFIVMKGARARS